MSGPANRYVALLRGINVGGKNKLPMRELVALFGEAGAHNVRTYIQSGNVVFSAPNELARKIPRKVAELIANRLGFRAPVVLRGAKAFQDVLKKNPFPQAEAQPTTLHVAFLADRPTRSAIASLDSNRSPGDAFAVVGSEVYLHLPNGAADTKLTNAYLDSTLSTTSTGRNWRTVLAIADMLRAP
jgi:uncharacterized protein (DUF1697 family)